MLKYKDQFSGPHKARKTMRRIHGRWSGGRWRGIGCLGARARSAARRQLGQLRLEVSQGHLGTLWQKQEQTEEQKKKKKEQKVERDKHQGGSAEVNDKSKIAKRGKNRNVWFET